MKEVVVPIIILSYQQLIEAKLELKALYDILPMKLDPTEVIILWNMDDYESVMQMKASWYEYANQHNIHGSHVYFSDGRGVDDYAYIHFITSNSRNGTTSDVNILKDYMSSSSLWPVSFELISFTDTVKEIITEGIKLIYINPGKNLEFFRAFVNKPKVLPSKLSHTVLFSLDHLIPINRERMIEQLLQHTVLQCPKTEASFRAALVDVFNQAEKKEGLIHQFKLGRMSQAFFITSLLKEIGNAISVRFTPAQLTAAWHAQYPDAVDIENKLSHFYEAMQEWRTALAFKLKAEFIVEASSLDMEVLMDILNKRNVPFQCIDGEMTHIAGLPVHISYCYQMERVDMIKTLAETKYSFRQFSPCNPCKLIYVTSKKISPLDEELKTIAWHVHAVHDEWDGVINDALKESVARRVAPIYSQVCQIQ